MEHAVGFSRPKASKRSWKLKERAAVETLHDNRPLRILNTFGKGCDKMFPVKHADRRIGCLALNPASVAGCRYCNHPLSCRIGEKAILPAAVSVGLSIHFW